MNRRERLRQRGRALRERARKLREMPRPVEPLTAKVGWLPLISWSLYDLANTVFSLNIVSLYFGLWIVLEMGGSDSHYGYANSISMLLIFLTAPVLGALSDQAKRRMPFLVVTTLVCVAFTALLGYDGGLARDDRLLLSLGIFVVANYFYQAGLIFYDSLLPVVSTDANRGRVGGVGIGLGYVGSFLGVGAGILLLGIIGYVGMFQVSALLFLMFSIPCFVFVRETETDDFWPSLWLLAALLLLLNAWLLGGDYSLALLVAAIIAGGAYLRARTAPLLKRNFQLKFIGGAFRQVRDTVRRVKQFPGLGRFLIGRMFYTDAVNTLIVFMGIYITGEFDFSTQQVQYFLLIGIGTSILGGFGWGWVVDWLGPKTSLNLVLWTWFFNFTMIIGVALFDLPTAILWVGAATAGIALSGTWAADRPYMLRLTPPRLVGQFYGLYSMVGRFATIIGPVMWALIVDTLGWGRPAAVAALFLFTIVGYIILQGVDDAPRDWPPELLADYEPEPPRGAIGRSR
ncbi:MAG: hypothetical protein CL960_04845 [Euryarchaeota archaeon]|nr:hypothetical protein [Euryarchaeota archaeon]MDP6363660.1 MFS transporter [Candidatus Poseidoniia archaeon]MDP6658518.1 MFS transporter [Candidatus Poseidoniia archaeon]MDP6846187.1 MFS transporter [Candidatus Poseidoniia archaeon]MDP7007460.1 MFS transporter [Candidatus Poseidoniia archaeon]